MLEIGTNYNAEKRLWEGPRLKPLYHPKVSIGQVVLNMLSMHGPKVAQISDDFGIQTTFSEMLTKTVRVAQNLQKFNYEPKSVFGILANNGPDLAPVILASFCLGCPISPMDPSFGKSELKSIITITKPNLFFCDANSYDLLNSCLIELNVQAKIITFNGQRGNSTSIETLFAETKDEMNFLPVDVDGEKETAMIAVSYTITGPLEGICLSHALILDKCTRLNFISSGDVLFAFSSVYWLSGIANLLKAAYFGATRIITTQPYSDRLLLELCEKYKITHLFASSKQMISALKSDGVDSMDLSSVKLLALSGPKVRLEEYAFMRKHLRNAVPCNMFGISELGGAVSMSRGGELNLNASGKLLNGMQVKIVDKDGNRLEIGERGQICVKSGYYFIGYYGKEHSQSILDEQGFLATGHIGYFDEDGFLYVIGREIDMINYGNVLVSPMEMENLLIQCPAIKSVCIVAVCSPKSQHLPLLAAVIVRSKNASISGDEVLNLIADHFNDSYKLRGGVYFVDSLPSTPSGKVIRRLAKSIAEKEFGARKRPM